MTAPPAGDQGRQVNQNADAAVYTEIQQVDQLNMEWQRVLATVPNARQALQDYLPGTLEHTPGQAGLLKLRQKVFFTDGSEDMDNQWSPEQWVQYVDIIPPRVAGGLNPLVSNDPGAKLAYEVAQLRIRRDAKALVDAEVPAVDPALVERMRAAMQNGDNLGSDGLEPLIEDYVFHNSLFRIIGAPGSLKSFVALDWACHIAAAKEFWRGQRIRNPQMGRVLYIAAEGAQGIGKRVAAWKQRYNVASLGALVVYPLPVNVDSAGWSALIQLAAVEIKPCMVIVDTQARATSGMNENDATAMGKLVDRCEDLQRATGAAVGLVHHSGKDSTDGRGSNSVQGAMQSEITVTKSGVSGSEVATLKSTRQKDDGRNENAVMATEVVQVGTDAYGRVIDSLVFTPWDQQINTPSGSGVAMRDQILDVLTEDAGKIGLTKAEVLRSLPAKAGTGDSHGRSFRREWNKAIESGVIGRVGSTERYRVRTPQELEQLHREAAFQKSAENGAAFVTQGER
jgi:hypothetical protein